MGKEAAAARRRAKQYEARAEAAMKSGHEGSAAEAWQLQLMAAEARREARYYEENGAGK